MNTDVGRVPEERSGGGVSRPRALTDSELLGEDRSPIARPTGAASPPYDIVFLDRDGVLNVQLPGYVTDPHELALLPGAAEAVRVCNDAACAVVLVTNQRGLATGDLTRAQLIAVHRSLVERLAAVGARLDGIQVCPHAHDSCGCRKPRAGLVREGLRRAAWADPARCVLLGDKAGDMAAAAAARVPSRLVGGVEPPLAWAVEGLIGDPTLRV